MTDSAYALSADGLCKSFGAVKVAQDVSFRVATGDALGIIGPNGAGKTTLFNLITGTLKADSGTISLYGKDITSIDARSRCHMGVARSFQVPQPFSGLTAYENVLIAAAFGRQVSEHAARPHAAEAIDRCGLGPKSDVIAGGLTLLDRKRLELARALATGPRLLLLDEIAGGLTEAECRDLVALIREIRAAGVTIIWIEHVLHALLSVVDSVMVLDFGQLIAQGDPDMIMKNPQVAAIYLGLDTTEEAHG
ncbi:ABC transporter ATP-binding protein [Rhizobium alvei]|uniref:ABC transporter ATP-binding protein n=1 Tax=Rhizobium alvei TaxID=1132659 RepID=A0ABT8YHT9_9HYPH|nr:ABC transporter ATP-binding protein [Rhizobium alvei]MDO6962888.1 ABC transporter ATP-binding protein [Rhizobium alvei]